MHPTQRAREIVDAQEGIHPHLETIVDKHRRHKYLKPIQDHNREAFQRFVRWREAQDEEKVLRLDSCCGTGISTHAIAESFPDDLIIGIDQSEPRLRKANNTPKNALLLRTNCEDFWRLCIDNKITFRAHTIFYPNPYPKAAQFTRRWHGHPVFPLLPQLSASLELRSNWKIYVEEFAIAWKILSGDAFLVEPYQPKTFITRFEEKYAKSGQALYRFYNQNQNRI